jgi:hypothetical protein
VSTEIKKHEVVPIVKRLGVEGPCQTIDEVELELSGLAQQSNGDPSHRSGYETRVEKSRPPGESRISVNHDLTMVDRVSAFVERFVFFQEESHNLLVAAWIIATYLQEEFDYAGYLFAYSPEPQSGKTTLLDVLNLLAANSSGIEISPTEATLFRTAQGCTQIFDEIDTWKNADDLRSVLNAGYKKGGSVTRFDKDSRSGLKPKKFAVYGPRALAGIGINTLHRATRDRTFAISMVRQKKSEKRDRLRIRKIGTEVESLKKMIDDWKKRNSALVAAIYEKSEFDYLDGFSDRTIDIAEPLAAIVEAAFKGRDSLVQARAKLTDAVRTTRNEQQSATADHHVLRHLLELAGTEDPLVGNASELAAMCQNLAETPDEHVISRVLRSYGLKTLSIRKPGETPKYRYTLDRGTLQDLVDRWAGDVHLEEQCETPVAPPEVKT